MRTIPLALLVLAAAGCNRSSVRAGSEPRQPPTGPLISDADTVDRVAPAVVTIRSARRVRAPQQFPFSDDPFFRQFFGNPNRNRSREDRSLVERALGSGVIVVRDGHVLTNHHVIDGADQISVELNDRRSLPAKVIGSDVPSDLALLKIEASNL